MRPPPACPAVRRGRTPRGITVSTGATPTSAKALPLRTAFSPATFTFQAPFGINRRRNRSSLGGVSPRLPTERATTHFVSEILQGASDDIRGTIWTDFPAAGSYMTRFTPNGYQDYVPLIQPWKSSVPAANLVGNNMDNLGMLRWVGTRHQPPNSCGCRCTLRQPAGSRLGVLQPGCGGGPRSWGASRHPGGVNALFGDGSVHFMKNSINALTWVQLGSIHGGRSHQQRCLLSRCWP